jgi:hypothetical protein
MSVKLDHIKASCERSPSSIRMGFDDRLYFMDS